MRYSLLECHIWVGGCLARSFDLLTEAFSWRLRKSRCIDGKPDFFTSASWCIVLHKDAICDWGNAFYSTLILYRQALSCEAVTFRAYVSRACCYSLRLQSSKCTNGNPDIVFWNHKMEECMNGKPDLLSEIAVLKCKPDISLCDCIT